MLFLVMGFISLVDEIQLMLISNRHICIRSRVDNTNFTLLASDNNLESKEMYVHECYNPCLFLPCPVLPFYCFITFILKNVMLVRRSTDAFKSCSFSGLDEGKLVCKIRICTNKDTVEHHLCISNV